MIGELCRYGRRPVLLGNAWLLMLGTLVCLTSFSAPLSVADGGPFDNVQYSVGRCSTLSDALLLPPSLSADTTTSDALLSLELLQRRHSGGCLAGFCLE